MKIGQPIDFTMPPHPKGVRLFGTHVRLEPLRTAQHGTDLFQAFQPASDDDWLYLFSHPVRDKHTYFHTNGTAKTSLSSLTKPLLFKTDRMENI